MGKVLDGLNEQRTEKVNRLKIAERERDNLSGSKGEAEAFMEKERDIRRKKNTLYQVHEYSAQQAAAQLSERKAQATEKLAYEQSKKTESDVQLAAMEKQYAQTYAVHTAISAEVVIANEQFSAFERRDVKLQEDKKHQSAQLKKLQDAVKKDAKKEEDGVREADAALAQLEKIRAQVDDIKARKADEEKAVEEIMSGMQEATSELRAQLEGVNANLATAERGIASLQTEKETVSTKAQLAKSRVDGAAKNIQGCEDKIAKIKSDGASAHTRAAAIDKEKAATVQQISDFETLLGDSDAEEQRLQGELRGAVANAEEAKAAMAHAKGGSGGARNVVAAIMKAAKKGGPLASAGVRGRLGDLATIDPEFDVAIRFVLIFIVCFT
jgi:structural maintenance of chromosome 4